ncbi:antitoxin [Agromyces sp. NPDC058484]|uniref:antitoxin n=1 Tax=Agromyces sp. NPDC058484 TaxID=3346524 RepID=UPI003656B7F2
MAELAKIDQRLERVRQSDRNDFRDGSPTYDSASIAVVRLAGILERSESARAREVLTEEESRGLQTIRKIISHGGNADMNDEVFWSTVTTYLPGLVRRLRDAVTDESR